MIRQYTAATQEAYAKGTSIILSEGMANGGMLGSFILLYGVLTVFGTFLIYRDVDKNGCDPSNRIDGNISCSETGPAVFGGMLGVAFAAQGMAQLANAYEAFAAARAALYPAMKAIRRTKGSPEEIIMTDAPMDTTTHSFKDEGDVITKTRVVLPAYTIDSSSEEGLKPRMDSATISFNKVEFSYPTRPDNKVLNGLDLVIEPGKTTALVGPSGGGKSTVMAMLERFYDPTYGTVSVDGVDLKDINIKYLRQQLAYVGQEPVLFATTVAGNIKYGFPEATQEQIENAARLANAHDFISSFPEGYNTQVGDKGAQLSGGQKQRIAIARVLVSNPKILLLDEATSALDSESERIVQEALDNLLAGRRLTTIVIAHRLSTIHNADKIAVISGGNVVEAGTHEELMVHPSGRYRNLVEKQETEREPPQMAPPMPKSSSTGSLDALDSNLADFDGIPHLCFRDVTFAYPTRPQKKVFNGFDLAVQQGDTVALVGPSGGGKSTTVSLIERFYDPDDGNVEYLGMDLKSLNVGWLRDQIGLVGQEPTLFNASIAENISYGYTEATRPEIEDAAKMANAHDFIMSFPDGYDTNVGERGGQLSGGQKQRVAIARALVKKPKVLLLDEATSALDSDSEAVVQEALDVLMSSKEHTTLVIAHRLSTIRNADKIAFVADGKVREYGSHEELMARPNGRYKRLVETQKRGATVDLYLPKKEAAEKTAKDEEEGKDENEETNDFEAEIEEEASKMFDMSRARKFAAQDMNFLLIGAVGAVLAGAVFPTWGIMFGQMIDLLFQPVFPCNEDEGSIFPIVELGYASCDEYISSVVDDMRDTSYELAVYWAIIVAGCLVGFVLLFYGFSTAGERMNKRVRDSAFNALVRQEVAFFDKKSVGSLTSQLQEDAARMHTFSGEPIRQFLVAAASLVTGLTVSFVYMWPFALLSLAIVPLMGAATEIEMRQFLGEDQGTDDADELNSPGGIAVESLLNIRTIAALTMEKKRYDDYEHALVTSDPHFIGKGFTSGAASGVSMLIQQWSNALQLWWGGWLIYRYPETYNFPDFLTAMFALLFSLFGLGSAMQGASDRKETTKSAGRIFYLLDRESAIDPLSQEGKKLS
eukprot:CAMPEP_0118702986 /NCGR_PEP_ID=MMETSP0800-20121206/18252_1 /TAXON_ID=210618 ORGANISM="Striatella unipunctata, Strain CCMP2910" /NCGR_SAMPLE_ID=MMETSP0800 /ASSEMBLY_ACC=CAM_ASM_000638 /LENGTH=1104 /DNA_ID=CAMNT_0006604361 /DNA_START=179 /DNA_END=3493 /DNA_ORIENTATION=-